MRKRITDLFKSVHNRAKRLFEKRVKEDKYDHVQKKEFTPVRKKLPSRWILSHNSIQAKSANQLRKRRKKNKMARKSRKINYRKAA